MPYTTPSNPMYELVDLSLDAVALCKEGANTRANIILTKGKEKPKMPATYEELMASLKPEQAEVIKKKITDELAVKDTTITTLNTKVSDLEKASKKPADPPKPAEEDILKSLSPEAKELIEKLKGTVDALITERADDLAKTRYEKCKALPAEEKALKDILKTASPAVCDLLEKASEAISKGILEGKGTDTNNAGVGVTADTAYAQLEKSAKDIMAKNSGMTFEKAFMEASTNDPATYKKYSERMR